MSSYPSMEWQEVPCIPASKRPYPPRPQVGGDTPDFEARVQGTISSAAGSFENVAGVTTETGTGGENSYSLQLNTNWFHTTACRGAADPLGCRGWQQFVYANPGPPFLSGAVFISYWLIGWGTTCPDGWIQTGTGDLSNCYLNTEGAPVPFQSIANLSQLSVTGTAGTMDAVSLSTGDTVYSSSNDSLVNLGQSGWQGAEFNVFGNGDSSEATLNAGSRMAVRISVNDGTTDIPECRMGGTTGESNNLTLVPPCCPYGGPSPAIVFWQSSNRGATSMCASGSSMGDTHLTNFAGLLFDFQASGDFLLAETNPDFVVQTRQASGAPTWPDASVNKAVAIKMGETRVAVCLGPTRFVVDGHLSYLRDGRSLSLPGIEVARNGNAYIFTRPSGENVRADVNDGWIDVSVGLGRAPEARVRGLLGNVNGNTGEDDLATRSRTLLKRPVSFVDLYHSYGESWRVPSDVSLPAQLCGDKIQNGNPKKPFYANDLKPKVYRSARAACRQAGVTEVSLLEACTLDTAVLGNRAAARAFVHAKPPRAVMRLGSGP